MFWRGRAERAQARRDREWRRIVRAISQPGGIPSENDHEQLHAYFEELRKDVETHGEDAAAERAA